MQARHACNVVLVRMGQDQQVDAPVPRRQTGIERHQQGHWIRPAIDAHRLPYWRIDLLVLTHPHEDHVAGAACLQRGPREDGSGPTGPMRRSHGGRMLVDGGPDPGRRPAALDARLPPWDRRIDLLVLTHPHEDHVAGMPRLQRGPREDGSGPTGRCAGPTAADGHRAPPAATTVRRWRAGSGSPAGGARCPSAAVGPAHRPVGPDPSSRGPRCRRGMPATWSS